MFFGRVIVIATRNVYFKSSPWLKPVFLSLFNVIIQKDELKLKICRVDLHSFAQYNFQILGLKKLVLPNLYSLRLYQGEYNFTFLGL